MNPTFASIPQPPANRIRKALVTILALLGALLIAASTAVALLSLQSASPAALKPAAESHHDHKSSSKSSDGSDKGHKDHKGSKSDQHHSGSEDSYEYPTTDVSPTYTGNGSYADGSGYQGSNYDGSGTYVPSTSGSTYTGSSYVPSGGGSYYDPNYSSGTPGDIINTSNPTSDAYTDAANQAYQNSTDAYVAGDQTSAYDYNQDYLNYTQAANDAYTTPSADTSTADAG
jgi:hypothetical protein